MRTSKHERENGWRKHVRKGRMYLMILFCGIVIIFGCTTVTRIPVTPILEVIEKDGLVCFTDEDAQALAIYILELEESVNP